MEQTYHFIDSLTDQIIEIQKESIVSRTLFREDHLKVVLFGFAAGQELSEHTASMPAAIQILSGRCRLTLGEDVKQAEPGTWVHMPANLPHSLLAETDVIMLLMLLKQAS
jgi:quercetin dioxygenase-like cupin family protein